VIQGTAGSPRLLIVFDGDDTLWETEPLYDRSRTDAAIVVARIGLDPEKFEQLQRQIDLENVLRLGLSSDRFPTSCVEAYERLAQLQGQKVASDVARRVWNAAAAVFDLPAPLAPGATEVLTELSRSHVLALVTKGDRAVQEKRVAQSGLATHFQTIQIVSDKSASTFSMLTSRHDIPARCAWSVGNSLPSDVDPALAAGMSAVWVDAHVWEHERRAHQVELDHPRLHVAATLYDVPTIISAHAAAAAR
jgi:putative hydrolase of the HAD superfamily